MADLCKICVGEKAVVSSECGAYWGDIWCPSCNLQMYLVAKGIVGDSRENSRIALDRLETQLSKYKLQNRMSEEEAAKLIRDAEELLVQIKANPEMGEKIIQEHSRYYREFRAKQK